MSTKVRALFGLIAVLTSMGLSSCGHYICHQTFGSATCSGSQTGFNGGNPGNGTTSAFAFAVDQGGTVDGYSLSDSAATFTSISDFNAPAITESDFGVGMVVAQGKFVYAALPLDDQLYGWSVDSTGALTPLSGFPITVTPTMVGNVSTFQYNQQVLTTNPAGNLLFLSEAGDQGILVYTIDSTSGALTSVLGSPFSTQSANLLPQNMAMDGLGKFLYVTAGSDDHTGTTVAAYSVASSGALTLLSGSTGFSLPIWEFQGEPSGKYMIGISGKTAFLNGSDDKSIHVYSINQSTGVLTDVAGSPFTTTYAPFNIAVSPVSTNGTFVYSFSVNDSNTGINPIEGYQLNTTSGALTAVTNSPFSNLYAGYWGQFDQTGDNLVVYGTATGSGTASAQLGGFAVGTGGVLTQTGAAVTLTTPGYWVVTDPQ
jgi:6-phosphogluconolactonase